MLKCQWWQDDRDDRMTGMTGWLDDMMTGLQDEMMTGRFADDWLYGIFFNHNERYVNVDVLI